MLLRCTSGHCPSALWSAVQSALKHLDESNMAPNTSHAAALVRSQTSSFRHKCYLHYLYHTSQMRRYPLHHKQFLPFSRLFFPFCLICPTGFFFHTFLLTNFKAWHWYGFETYQWFVNPLIIVLVFQPIDDLSTGTDSSLDFILAVNTNNWFQMQHFRSTLNIELLTCKLTNNTSNALTMEHLSS